MPFSKSARPGKPGSRSSATSTTPRPPPLAPLLSNTNLQDIFAHPNFSDGGRPGTYGNCAASDKIDYLLAEIPVGKTLAFSSLFAGASARGEVIVTFLALLELIKLNHFKIEQPDLFGDIQLTRFTLT